MKDSQIEELQYTLLRIAVALESSAGTGILLAPEDWGMATAWLWQAHAMALKPVTKTGSLPLDLLIGIDNQADTLLENTKAFAGGFSANNALLWGARGTGKSSLVKAIHNDLDDDPKYPLHLIEIYREDLNTLPYLLDILREEPDIRFYSFLR